MKEQNSTRFNTAWAEAKDALDISSGALSLLLREETETATKGGDHIAPERLERARQALNDMSHAWEEVKREMLTYRHECDMVQKGQFVEHKKTKEKTE